MAPRRREEPPGPTTAAVLADDLRRRILSGDPGPGAPLREEGLARAHGVSRHTVRSALAVLASERLVVVEPYRGARVAALDDAALVALQELRGALEAEAVRLLRERHGVAWPAAVLAPVEEALTRLERADGADPGDWPETARAHAGVHRALVSAAGSPRITEAYERLDSEILLLLLHVRPHYPRGSLTAEHRAYVAATRRRGGAAVRAHLAHSTALIVEARPHEG